jgi:hypothetical protein
VILAVAYQVQVLATQKKSNPGAGILQSEGAEEKDEKCSKLIFLEYAGELRIIVLSRGK